jgi:hypothetical protein
VDGQTFTWLGAGDGPTGAQKEITVRKPLWSIDQPRLTSTVPLQVYSYEDHRHDDLRERGRDRNLPESGRGPYTFGHWIHAV